MNMCTAWRTPATGGVLAEVRIRSGRYPPSVADRCCGKSLAPACRSSDRRRKHLAGPRESACCAKPNTAVLSGLFGRQNSSRRCRARQSCRPRCASAPAERGPRRKRPLAQIRDLQGPAPGAMQRLRSFCAYRKNAARGQFAPLKACQKSGKVPKPTPSAVAQARERSREYRRRISTHEYSTLGGTVTKTSVHSILVDSPYCLAVSASRAHPTPLIQIGGSP